MTNKRLKDTLKKYDKSKQSKEVLISGTLGITLGGSRVVEVPNRKGFVYVRLKGNTSELIQAFNATVSPVYDLPVFVIRNNSIYKVVGRNIDRYPSQFSTEAPYLPKHGAQHSFNTEIGAGGDVTWIYSKQFMPFLSYPSGSAGSLTLSFYPGFYEWNGQWKFAQNTGTPSYSPYIPSITGAARMVLSYLDPTDNSIKLVPGTPFSNSLTGSADIAQYIPDIPREVGIPLAAVRLVTGTTSIGWDAIYDLRDFWTVGKPSGSSGGGGGGSSGLVGWDEGVYIATGTILNVTGQRAVLSASGTVLNLTISPDPFDNVGAYITNNGVSLGTGTRIDVGNNLTASLSGTVLRIDGQAGGGGGGGGLGVVAWDEGVPIATGTVFNFVGTGVTTTASGTVVQVSVDSEPWLIDIWGTASDRFQTSGTWTIAAYTDGGVTFYPTNIGLQSDGNQNSSVSWALAMSQGTWNTTIYCRKSTNTGIFTLNIDGSSVGTADSYAAAPAMGVLTITGTISATGKHTVQLKMATKNASSSGYFGEIFFVSFRRTA